MADAAELDAVWRQTVAEFDRGLQIARGLLRRGQFAQAMQAVEQCQALLGVMDGLQQKARLVPAAQVVFVPALADVVAAPTVAELAAGTDITRFLRSGDDG